MLDDLFGRQYAHPQGLLGHIAGWRMARQHRPENWWTVAILDARTDDNILELGCGPGFAVQQLARTVRRGFIAGVDLSETMVAAACRRNARAVRRGLVQLHCADVVDLPFDDGRFDKVFSIHSIYFWPDPLRALQEVWRVLRPDGLLALTVLPRERWGRSATDELAGSATCRPYSGDELMVLLAMCGFGDVRILADANHVSAESNYTVLGCKQPECVE